MNKQIPYIFEDATLYRDLTPIQNFNNIGRSRIRAFYKGKNRNGSFINEDIARQLIYSATRGNTPVIGFYNYETQDFERHMGPQIAKGYGYIPVDCNFAWEDYTDEFGITRTYACFDCVLFCDYFEEAKQIIGKPQSMELNRETIVGDWREIDGEEYFVYSFAEMKGFCVLGSEIEPCFEASSFFEKDCGSKFDKFSLLLSDLMEKVKEAEIKEEGGEQTMNEEQKFEMTTEEEVVEETVTEEAPVTETEENEVSTEEVSEEQPSEYDILKKDFDELQNQHQELIEKFESLTTDFTSLQETVNSLNADLTAANEERNTLQENNQKLTSQLEEELAKIASYEAEANKIELSKKEKLVSDYEKVLSEEEINEVKPLIADFSYDELESKLAISFSRKNMEQVVNRVPTPEPELTDFEKLMAKYKK